jgi:hypothetical protein
MSQFIVTLDNFVKTDKIQFDKIKCGLQQTSMNQIQFVLQASVQTFFPHGKTALLEPRPPYS